MDDWGVVDNKVIEELGAKDKRNKHAEHTLQVFITAHILVFVMANH